jgi:hypothetical protein
VTAEKSRLYRGAGHLGGEGKEGIPIDPKKGGPFYDLGTSNCARFCLDYHPLNLGESFKIAVMSLTVIVIMEVDKWVRKK